MELCCYVHHRLIWSQIHKGTSYGYRALDGYTGNATCHSFCLKDVLPGHCNLACQAQLFKVLCKIYFALLHLDLLVGMQNLCNLTWVDLTDIVQDACQ